jgi:UDP-glucose 4-epimerase
MRILILGGTGFIGSHIIDALVKLNHTIKVIDRTLKHTIPTKEIEYIQADFSNQEKLLEALSGVDLVIHLISTTGPKSSNLDPIADTESNLINTLKLINAMEKANVKRLIYFSSGGTVYGNPTQVPITERHTTRPLCSYGITKLAIEHHLFMHQELNNLRVTVLRPSNPYGPRQGNLGSQGVIATFANQIKNKQPIKVWGDGTIIRDYIYISDLVSACTQAIQLDITGTFNIGSGQGFSLKQVIANVEMALKQKANVIYADNRNFDVKKIILDTSLAKEKLKWRPEIKFEEGIERYCSWLNNQTIS